MDKDIEIYVEDDLSKAMIGQICSEEGCPKRTFISTFGAVSNAFPLVVATVGLRDLDQKNILFVLDGDCYRRDNERIKQISKHLTGLGSDQNNLRKRLLLKIKQFIIPDGSKPEEYYHSLIISSLENVDMSDQVRDLYQEIRNFNTAGVDHHKWFTMPMDDLGMTRERGYAYIAEMLSKCAAWEDITSEIRIWIREQLGKVGSVEECTDRDREEQSPSEED
jgi:ibfA protein